MGEYHVSWAVAWPDDGGDAIAGSVEVTVTPAALTGKPAFGSGEGKTLGEVEVTYPESWPEGGTFTWEAGAGTQIVQGTSYAYTYTSLDGNYAASGSVILWAAPSTGGGGGGYVPPSPPVTTTGQGSTATTTTTTAAPSASVSGGKATATVDTSTGGEIVKQAVANARGADVLVLGTSRSMQLRGAFFASDSFYNAGGGIAYISQAQVFLENMPPDARPKHLLLVLDQYFYNETWTSIEPEDSAALRPSSWMAWMVCSTGLSASMWNVSRFAPAAQNGFIYCSGRRIIRCTS